MNDYCEHIVFHSRSRSLLYLVRCSVMQFVEKKLGRIRHMSSKYLESIGVGNLGYAISELYRGKGYGNILLKELLKKCISFGYSHIKLFPYKNNIPTIKVMLKNGGQIVDSFDDEKYVIVTFQRL